MRFSAVAALAASVATVSAQGTVLGFNSGALKDDRSTKFQADYEQEFNNQKKLRDDGDEQFTAVRLYTNIQPGTSDGPIEAIPAAIKTQTKLLLGMWVSGDNNLDKELSALEKAIKQYGTKFTDLVVGISVGSEDLYRTSEAGLLNKENVGLDPDTLVDYIKETRDKIKGTSLADASIGHVDTWTVWANGSNKAVVDALDWIGTDAYAYYEDTKDNSVDNAKNLWDDAWKQTEANANGKPIWVTETGWPTAGPTRKNGVPSAENAKKYWDAVACEIIGKYNTFWYIQRDSNADNKDLKFGLNPKLDGKPLYDLSCSAKKNETSTDDDDEEDDSSSGSGSGSGSGSSSGSGSGSKNNGTSSNNGGSSSSGGSSGSGGSGSGSNTSVSSPSPSASGSGSGSGSAEDDALTGAASTIMPKAVGAIAGLAMLFALLA